ncbi:MAG: hypothetical protein E4G94_03905 [ANME-2 cluster archaeon]|nr:MAG: hypothetical protein E4G94_03905 [ANME-2 cluster archaeon]
MAPALTGITSNFTSPKLPIQSKSACQPQNHKTGRSRSGTGTGQSAGERGGRRKTRFVIHTVGPIWRNGSKGEPGQLNYAYLKSLDIAM